LAPGCLISIGVPARNEARFIAETLDSVLAQDREDWELTVSDNASTDGTTEIVRKYASRDRRIRLERVDAPLSQVENFNRLARGARAPYFAWVGGHDRWDRTFLSRCVGALEEDPQQVLSFTDVSIIGPEGEPISTLCSLDTRLCLTAEARFITFLFSGMNGVHIHGLMRTEALARTSLLRPSLFPDITFVAELALLGGFVRLEGPPLFALRMAREKPWTERVEALGQDGSPAWASVLPWHHVALECLRVPCRRAAGWPSRLAALGGALTCALTSLGPRLGAELRSAARHGFSRKHHQPDQHPSLVESIRRAIRR
jgi:hypothetical protein